MGTPRQTSSATPCSKQTSARRMMGKQPSSLCHLSVGSSALSAPHPYSTGWTISTVRSLLTKLQLHQTRSKNPSVLCSCIHHSLCQCCSTANLVKKLLIIICFCFLGIH